MPAKAPLPPVSAVYAQERTGEYRRVPAAKRAMAPMGSAPVLRLGREPAFDLAAASSALQLPPTPWGLRMASVMQSLWVAPLQLAPGMLAGAAALEVSLLSIDRKDALSPFVLYAKSSLDFQRVYFWLSLPGLVAVALLMKKRARGFEIGSDTHILWPMRLVLLCYVVILITSFVLREHHWEIGLDSTKEYFPFAWPAGAQLNASHYASQSCASLAPASGFVGGTDVAVYGNLEAACARRSGHSDPCLLLECIRGRREAFDRMSVWGEPPPGALVLRAVCCLLSLLVSFVPSMSEGEQNSAELLAAALPPERQHVLHSTGAFLCRGISYALSFPRGAGEDMRESAYKRPPPAPDGGPPLPPTPAGNMRKYSGFVQISLFALGVDLLCNSLLATVHWEQTALDGFFSGTPYDRSNAYEPYLNDPDHKRAMLDCLAPDMVLIIVTLLARGAVGSSLYFMLLGTTNFRLRRLDQLFKEYCSTVMLQFVCTIVTGLARTVRIICIIIWPRESYELEPLWERELILEYSPAFQRMYSAVLFIDMALTAAYYVASIDVLRRLARSYQ